MINIASLIGKSGISIAYKVGFAFMFIFAAISSIFAFPVYYRNIVQQIIFIGFYSLPVVALTTFFSGGVLALQSYIGFSRFAAESAIPNVVVLSITRELGPVLTGLMVAGRVGASIAAEIATMRVTEQIDALYTLSTDPIRYLVFPRILSATIMLPCLVLIGDVLGVMGGYAISVYTLDFNSSSYIINTIKFLHFDDVISGLIKSAVFGFIITTISCYNGYYSEKGAKGVGKATTSSVVISSILILSSDYIMTSLFFDK